MRTPPAGFNAGDPDTFRETATGARPTASLSSSSRISGPERLSADSEWNWTPEMPRPRRAVTSQVAGRGNSPLLSPGVRMSVRDPRVRGRSCRNRRSPGGRRTPRRAVFPGRGVRRAARAVRAPRTANGQQLEAEAHADEVGLPPPRASPSSSAVSSRSAPMRGSAASFGLPGPGPSRTGPRWCRSASRRPGWSCGTTEVPRPAARSRCAGIAVKSSSASTTSTTLRRSPPWSVRSLSDPCRSGSSQQGVRFRRRPPRAARTSGVHSEAPGPVWRPRPVPG